MPFDRRSPSAGILMSQNSTRSLRGLELRHGGALSNIRTTLTSKESNHLSRHLTRYYTLPLFIGSFLVPPIFILLFILCGIVIGVDYVRLNPEMDIGRYALCSLLDDCAYEVGVVWGCMKHRTWKPLLPVIKIRVRR